MWQSSAGPASYRGGLSRLTRQSRKVHLYGYGATAKGAVPSKVTFTYRLSILFLFFLHFILGHPLRFRRCLFSSFQPPCL